MERPRPFLGFLSTRTRQRSEAKKAAMQSLSTQSFSMTVLQSPPAARGSKLQRLLHWSLFADRVARKPRRLSPTRSLCTSGWTRTMGGNGNIFHGVANLGLDCCECIDQRRSCQTLQGLQVVAAPHIYHSNCAPNCCAFGHPEPCLSDLSSASHTATASSSSCDTDRDLEAGYIFVFKSSSSC